jgi:hypothetical protein
MLGLLGRLLTLVPVPLLSTYLRSVCSPMLLLLLAGCNNDVLCVLSLVFSFPLQCPCSFACHLPASLPCLCFCCLCFCCIASVACTWNYHQISMRYIVRRLVHNFSHNSGVLLAVHSHQEVGLFRVEVDQLAISSGPTKVGHLDVSIAFPVLAGLVHRHSRPPFGVLPTVPVLIRERHPH